MNLAFILSFLIINHVLLNEIIKFQTKLRVSPCFCAKPLEDEQNSLENEYWRVFMITNKGIFKTNMKCYPDYDKLLRNLKNRYIQLGFLSCIVFLNILQCIFKCFSSQSRREYVEI